MSEEQEANHRPPPLRVLLAVGIGTCLSLFGDASLYAVLPTHTIDAGVSLANVGILLSINRFVRLVLNGPVGAAYDRWPRRPLFVSALFVGAFSTAIYWLTQGVFPLVAGRLLWGLAWAGIWIGGNTIVLDVAHEDTRGRWIGAYHLSFFMGSAGGSLLGGLLTDRLGYHQSMAVCAALTFMGALVSLIFLPETSEPRRDTVASRVGSRRLFVTLSPAERTEFVSAAGLFAVNRLALAGVLQSTLGLFLLEQAGDQVQVAGYSLGVATLTGLGLGASTLIAMTSAPIIGRMADRASNRWRVAAGGLAPGTVGLGMLAAGLPLTALIGLPLAAITNASNQNLATAIVGGLGNRDRRSRRLGILFTVGDLASAVGPPLAYALIPVLGIRSIYLLGAGLFALMALVALRRAATSISRPAPI